MEPLIRVRNLTKQLGKGCMRCLESTGPEHHSNLCPHCGTVMACNDVSFDLYPNEALGVVGESGSGKSTLVRLLHFEWEATSGSMELHRKAVLGQGNLCETVFNGSDYSHNLLDISHFQKRQIRNALMGIVYQNPNLGLRMQISSGGNIAERLLSAGWRSIEKMRGRSSELLEKTEIPVARMDEAPSRFSGGMQQRVQIAKALSNNPLILFLDEVTTASGIIREINQFRNKLHVNTRIHARFEITDTGAVPFLENLIRDGEVDLFSIMDHSPGQGQFRDILAYKKYYGPVYAKTDREMDTIIERKLKAKETDTSKVIAHLVDVCRENGISVASHDDDSREKIHWLKTMDIGVTEFPVNAEALSAAHEHGIRVCLGSPNVVRGKSQASNLSARDAISQGFGDILCSDYSPMTLLHAVFTLERHGILSLHEAVRMVSINPASAVGIDPWTGSIEEGKDADLVLVDNSDTIPRVIKTFVSGKEVFSTC